MSDGDRWAGFWLGPGTLSDGVEISAAVLRDSVERDLWRDLPVRLFGSARHLDHPPNGLDDPAQDPDWTVGKVVHAQFEDEDGGRVVGLIQFDETDVAIRAHDRLRASRERTGRTFSPCGFGVSFSAYRYAREDEPKRFARVDALDVVSRPALPCALMVSSEESAAAERWSIKAGVPIAPRVRITGGAVRLRDPRVDDVLRSANETIARVQRALEAVKVGAA